MKNDSKKSKKNSQAAGSSEVGIDEMRTKGLSQGQIIRRKFFSHKPAVAGLIFMVLFTIFVYSAAGIHLGSDEAKFTIHGWWQFSHEDILDPGPCADGCPSSVHPMGQLPDGRDYFAQVAWLGNISHGDGCNRLSRWGYWNNCWFCIRVLRWNH